MRALRTVVCLALGLAGCAGYPEGSLLDGVRPGADCRINVMAVFAHPDDESFYTGGTLIKLGKDPRVRLHVLCLTNGNMDEAKDNLGITREMLGRMRVKELESAAMVLGASTAACMGYDDQGLAGADGAELSARVEDAVRKAGADVIITHDPYGLSGHEDHIVCSRVATAAFSETDAQRLYYVTMSPARYRFNLLFALSDSPAEKSVPTVRVNIRAEKTMKRLALYAHVTQHHFSFWNALAMREDLLFDYEHFALAGARDGVK
mgnify:CR=1 FL=1